MKELTKAEKKQAKELLKKGILRRHAEWQNELRQLLDRPFDDEIGNEFGRSMKITDKARDFFKEAMRMEDYYRNSRLPFGLMSLYRDGYLTSEEIAELPNELSDWIRNY